MRLGESLTCWKLQSRIPDRSLILATYGVPLYDFCEDKTCQGSYDGKM